MRQEKEEAVGEVEQMRLECEERIAKIRLEHQQDL